MSQLTYEDIKDFIDVEALIEGLGIDVVEKGDERESHCPLPIHGGHDNNPSFSINVAKRKFNCWSCAGGGDLSDLVMQLHEVDEDAALDYLRQFITDNIYNDHEAFMLRVKRNLYFSAEPEANSLPVYNSNVLTEWIDKALNTEGTRAWYTRGIITPTILRFNLGYDPYHTRFNTLTKSQYVGPVLITPHFYERALVGYQCRWLEDPDGVPKYTNTDNFPKAETIFGYDVAKDEPSTEYGVIVVESAVTALFLWGYGYNVVATFGASLKPEQIRLLREFPELTLAFDNDKVGHEATDKAIAALGKSNRVYVAPFMPGEKEDYGDLWFRPHPLQAERLLYDMLERRVPSLKYKVKGLESWDSKSKVT